MSSFTKPLDSRQIEGTEHGHLILSSFVYWIGEEYSDKFIWIPEGFETDFSSIPRSLQWLVPKYGKHNQPAVIHDCLYRFQFVWKVLGDGSVVRVRIKRKECDRIMLEANKLKGVNLIRRQLIHKGLRVGGWASFDDPDTWGWNEVTHLNDIQYATSPTDRQIQIAEEIANGKVAQTV